MFKGYYGSFCESFTKFNFILSKSSQFWEMKIWGFKRKKKNECSLLLIPFSYLNSQTSRWPSIISIKTLKQWNEMNILNWLFSFHLFPSSLRLSNRPKDLMHWTNWLDPSPPPSNLTTPMVGGRSLPLKTNTGKSNDMWQVSSSKTHHLTATCWRLDLPNPIFLSGQQQVEICFTWSGQIECGLSPNPIWHNSWSLLLFPNVVLGAKLTLYIRE